jgi:hypothetical protein
LIKSSYRQTITRQFHQLIQAGPSLILILEIAFVLRIVASVLVQVVASRRGTVCLFGDTPIYWQYARTMASFTTYVVYQWDVPHYALRTPGYPLWLAGWMVTFGEWAFPIRIGQSILSLFGVLWLYQLAKELGFSETSARWSAAFLAFDPFQIISVPLLLTESIFTPVLVVFMLYWVRIIKSYQKPLDRHAGFLIVFGMIQGLLSLIRPAWWPFLLVIHASFVALRLMDSQFRYKSLLRHVLLFQLGWSIVMMPWMVRNQLVIGQSAIGGTWGGASLYDGVQPFATGSSDMSFVAAPEFRDLSETDQDSLWKSLSYREIRNEPLRVARLSLAKQLRFWSAWPNDSAKVSMIVKAICGLIVWPIWGLMWCGLWKNRKNRLVYLVVSPLIFTALLHLLFVGSSRYRMAVILPAMVLTGEGMVVVLVMVRRWFQAK